MIELRVIGPERWRDWRTLRLQALAEAPYAFGSRLADWQDAPEQRWRQRLAGDSCNVLAERSGEPVGMASGQTSDGRPAELISMWVAPSARGHGVGDALITAVAAWARDRGADQLWLDVAVGNEAAAALYRRNGFRPDGAPVDGEQPMVRPLGGAPRP